MQDDLHIHWVSPLPPAKTDIAHYTSRILPELAERCRLTLWTDAETWDPALESYCDVQRLDPDTVLPRDFHHGGLTDKGAGTTKHIAFVHIGNSWVFHSGYLRLIHRIPSIIVLHDLSIQECLFEAIANGLYSEDLYKDEILKWYGPEALEICEAALQFGNPSTIPADIFGFEVTLKKALGVIVHTPTAFQMIQDKKAVPVYELNLPFRATPQARASQASEVNGATRQGPLRFVQFGFIGPNRRLEQVLDSLASVKDQIDFQFDILGEIWAPDHIQSKIDAFGLTDRIKIHGFVEEQVLDHMLSQADLVFNLRYPSMGEASGSQLRIWNAQVPSVVSDHGWYATLPSASVFKVSLDTEKQDLIDLIQTLWADPTYGNALRDQGYELLQDRHNPASYADSIVQIADETVSMSRDMISIKALRQALGSGSGACDLLCVAGLKAIS